MQDNPTPNRHDNLYCMFNMQELFMRRLQDLKGKHAMPDWPLDMNNKDHQILLKGIAYESMGELHEAVKELKNSKQHRQTNILEFDREKFLEEMVDTFKYFLEILIFIGVESDEFFEAYSRKDSILHKRIDNGY